MLSKSTQLGKKDGMQCIPPKGTEHNPDYSILWPIFGALFIWLLCSLIRGAAGIGFVFVPLVLILAILRIRWMLLLLLISPFCIVPIVGWNMGTFGYVTGKGKLYCFGNSKEFYIDRNTRAQWASIGEAEYGEQLLTIPNNLAIRGFTLLFGRMRGTYGGPYPSIKEAQEALKSGILVEPKIESGVFLVHLQFSDEHYALKTYAFRHFMKLRDGWIEYRNAKAIIYDGRCLLFEIVLAPVYSRESNERWIYLIDIISGKPIGLYIEDSQGNWSTQKAAFYDSRLI